MHKYMHIQMNIYIYEMKIAWLIGGQAALKLGNLPKDSDVHKRKRKINLIFVWNMAVFYKKRYCINIHPVL